MNRFPCCTCCSTANTPSSHSEVGGGHPFPCPNHQTWKDQKK